MAGIVVVFGRPCCSLEPRLCDGCCTPALREDRGLALAKGSTTSHGETRVGGQKGRPVGPGYGRRVTADGRFIICTIVPTVYRAGDRLGSCNGWQQCPGGVVLRIKHASYGPLVGAV